jgi:hypothetical protein
MLAATVAGGEDNPLVSGITKVAQSAVPGGAALGGMLA